MAGKNRVGGSREQLRGARRGHTGRHPYRKPEGGQALLALVARRGPGSAGDVGIAAPVHSGRRATIPAARRLLLWSNRVRLRARGGVALLSLVRAAAAGAGTLGLAVYCRVWRVPCCAPDLHARPGGNRSGSVCRSAPYSGEMAGLPGSARGLVPGSQSLVLPAVPVVSHRRSRSRCVARRHGSLCTRRVAAAACLVDGRDGGRHGCGGHATERRRAPPGSGVRPARSS